MIKSLLLAVSIVAHEPGYYTSLANHVQRWLRNENVPAQVVTPKTMSAALAKERLAFLVGFATPAPAEMQALRAFRARGGKFVVFHSSAPALAELMGVKPLGYISAPYPGAWSRMDFIAGRPAGFPAAIRQTSTVLQSAVPLKGKGRVLATWSDRNGRSTGKAAWIETAAGWWMTHVLLADGDEKLKARLVSAMVGAADPKAWSLAASEARAKRTADSLRAYAQRQVPRAGEIHAVWDHSGCGLYPGDWLKTMKVLSAAHVTDLFVNVAGAGFAHYPSSVLPRSKTYADEGDQLAKCVQAGRACGVRVHAWILCFNATRTSPEQLESFRKRGWRLRTKDGRVTDYLDPSNPIIRGRILAAVDEIVANYRVDGIHLDFVRWYEGAAKPKNAASVITAFVSEVRRHVKRPTLLSTAVLGKYPACVGSVGQDWPRWAEANLVDYVVPMDYTESNELFTSYVAQHAASRVVASKTIAGLGVTANESRLNARDVIDQVRIVRQYGLAGEALFDLDVTLETDILPYLRMGLW